MKENIAALEIRSARVPNRARIGSFLSPRSGSSTEVSAEHCRKDNIGGTKKDVHAYDMEAHRESQRSNRQGRRRARRIIKKWGNARDAGGVHKKRTRRRDGRNLGSQELLRK